MGNVSQLLADLAVFLRWRVKTQSNGFQDDFAQTCQYTFLSALGQSFLSALLQDALLVGQFQQVLI